jgi:transcriptional regulator with XRE-family HTH domain
LDKIAKRKAYQKFLERLVAARKKSGLTQPQVARAIGQHQSFVSKCESGERRVDVVELQELAKLYRVPLSFFA